MNDYKGNFHQDRKAHPDSFLANDADAQKMLLPNFETSSHDFQGVRISIASPDQIRSWSFGEVTKPETINYRTFKPERDGLCCARIFGPIKDYECLCGKYKRMKYKGVVCERCGVEVTLSKVRRERMGHIELATPVAHVWYSGNITSRIGSLLNMTNKNLDRILYFDGYVVIDPGLSFLDEGQVMGQEEVDQAYQEYGAGSFRVGSGAEALKELLSRINLSDLIVKLHDEIQNSGSDLKRKKAFRRLKIAQGFLASKTRPEWMILDVIPVMPPSLRPLVPLDGGRFAASDLNDLYRRLINRNNRLKRLIDLRAPNIILNNEKRMLQEIVDAFFDNGRRGKPILGSNKRPLKSVSETLRGKQGRFRMNLLGKRVDFSARSVIVAGPKLKLHQCGLPKLVALEMFSPHVCFGLQRCGFASTLKVAKAMIDRKAPEVWDILAEVMKGRVVLLNRAPTLHRLGIQAFEPMLTEGKAILLHPLVCTAFNADFDGDQMAVHLPLSLQAQIESRTLMMSTRNILSPASGASTINPTKDIVLGLFYLTMEREGEKGEGKVFSGLKEALAAWRRNTLSLHAKIIVRCDVIRGENVQFERVHTTLGRLILWNIVPHHPMITFDLINQAVTSKNVGSLLKSVFRYCGRHATVVFSDDLMQLGFEYGTKSGISFGKDDLVVPKSKQETVSNAMEEVSDFQKQYFAGLITADERYNKIMDTWTRCADTISEDMMQELSKDIPGQRMNSLYMMVHSGARGSASQMRQLAAMRGLIARHDGSIIEHPVISNFQEGLKAFEYFNSSHGARKGLSDTALKTSYAGYFTRRLVDVAQDYVVLEKDCGTSQGMTFSAVIEGQGIVSSLADRVLGRTLAEDVVKDGEVLLSAGCLLSSDHVELLDAKGVSEVKVRSVLFCQSERGCCTLCYGRDLGRGELVKIGEVVGIVAAQSVGEPGTQLTLRTFHSGGATDRGAESSFVDASQEGVVRVQSSYILESSEGDFIVMDRSTEVVIHDEVGRGKAVYKLPYGSKLFVKNGETVQIGKRIASWDPYTIPVIAEESGQVSYQDLYRDLSFKEVLDDVTGISKHIVTDWRQTARGEGLRPAIALMDEQGKVLHLGRGGEARYEVVPGSVLFIKDNDYVKKGDVLAKLSREVFKSRDITGGLPRVADLLEARRPKEPSVISDIDGIISFGKENKTRRRVVVTPHDENGRPIEYVFSKDRHILVQNGERVQKGDCLVDGTLSLDDILSVLGVEALAHHMVKEIQSIYRLHGVTINDKHIEVILHQMLRKVKVTDPGGSSLIAGDEISLEELRKENNRLRRAEKSLVQFVPILQGITKSSLRTDSFIAGASFQETTRVLIDAAIQGKVDPLVGVKENVIIGRPIPAGAGLILRQAKEEARRLDDQMSETINT